MILKREKLIDLFIRDNFRQGKSSLCIL